MFTPAWFKREIEELEAQQKQLIVQLHNTDGAIIVLKQMQAALNAEDGIPLEEFVDTIMPGATIESIDPVEDVSGEEIAPLTIAGAMSFDTVIPDEQKESEHED